MEIIFCLNCSKELVTEEIKKGTTLSCDCGCLQKCLDKNDEISRWRVMNPFSFDDKRVK